MKAQLVCFMILFLLPITLAQEREWAKDLIECFECDSRYDPECGVLIKQF